MVKIVVAFFSRNQTVTVSTRTQHDNSRFRAEGLYEYAVLLVA
jgi:hypothetical protein